MLRNTSYSAKTIDGNHLEFITDVDGEQGKGSATLSSGKLQVKFGGDYDFIIWRRSETTTSALNPDYYRPPEKDKNGRVPEDVVRLIYKLLESGDTAEVSKHFSAPFLHELETGSHFHKSVEDFLANLNTNGERRLKTVEKTRFMIGKTGLWNVAYTLVDVKGSELGMGQYFRMIDGEWKMVSRFTEQ